MTARRRKINRSLVATAMTRRITQRVACRGSILLPAVPALVDHYAKLCAEVFAASGRGFRAPELEEARRTLFEQLTQAFAGSQRSKVEIRFEAESARPLGYTVMQVPRSIAEGYERWLDDSGTPLFGAHPDARVSSLAAAFPDPSSSPILDFGAGTGRNALALARLGYPVDAVEITPRFAEILRHAAAAQDLRIGIIVDDVFRNRTALARDHYRLLFASEVVPDFRGVTDLRHLFELASDVLCERGLLVFNVHLSAQGFSPDKAARELAQQCYSCLFTPGEVEQAAEGLPFVLIANDSVHDFEKEHLSAGAFPPTPWYVNWTTGRDVYEVDRAECPVDMRWLVFEKRSHETAAGGAITEMGASLGASKPTPARRFDPSALRKAVAGRLMRRMIASGTLTLPAIPDMLDTYTNMGSALFAAIDRKPDEEQTRALRSHLKIALGKAFAESQRSNVVLAYEAPFGEDLRYTMTADPVPLPQAYAQWYEGLGDALFGIHPDARLLSTVDPTEEPSACPVLDAGAGLGRNAIHLAQRGYPVDAVELAPCFTESLRAEAVRQRLPIRVVTRDLLDCVDELRHDYKLVLLSGTAGDLRDFEQLRRLFEIASAVLVRDGQLVLSVHMAFAGYVPDAVGRQWAQQCGAMFFTERELSEATAGLPLVLLSDESAHDYEQKHLPESAWPPTPFFAEWALGQHMFALDREQCPIELRWLQFRKT